MSAWQMILLWIGCVIVGAIIGFAIGWGLWKLGLEIIGSTVALVGAAVGGFVVLFAVMKWMENRA